MTEKQIQKAGANSNQIQASIVNQYFGVSEKRVEEIVDERCALVLSNCVLESRLVAEQRVSDFKTEVLSIFARKPELVLALKEPSCVDTLERAAYTAAKSSEPSDQRLLSELLGRRFEEPHNRHVATGINKAIEIVDMLTDDELNGLTVFFAVCQYSPASGSICEGLAALDSLYEKLPVHNLPSGDAWIENLDILDALRATELSSLKNLVDWFYTAFKGYVVWGIEKGTEQYTEAVGTLSEVGIPADLLVDHELHDGYVRLKLCNRNRINDLQIPVLTNGLQESASPNEEQNNVINKLFDQTDTPGHEQEMKNALEMKLENYGNISAVRKWWDSIPSAPKITIVGKALANANARRIDPELPDLKL